MLEPIIPAIIDANRKGASDLLDASVRAHVSRTVDRLRRYSDPIVLAPLAAGTLRIVGARYDLGDGSVDFFDEGEPAPHDEASLSMSIADNRGA